MESYVCPRCGAKYFLSERQGPKRIFQVGAGREVLLCDEDDEDGKTDSMSSKIDCRRIYCGGCAWQGTCDELVASQD